MEGSSEDHEISETKKIINCEICNTNFPCLEDLHKHQRILHGSMRGYRCGICSYIAKTPTVLKHHRKKHEVGAKFQCEICHQICLCKSQLLRHIRYKHTNEKPYKCKQCPFASVEYHKLKDHLIVHAGELNYQCKTCDKSFRNATCLKRHEKTHEDSMEWVCILCFQEVKAGGNLCSHMIKMHHVRNFHRDGPHTSRENGLPETLKMYINTLGLKEEDVMKDRIIRYYSIQPEYSHSYSENFKNVSPIICRMESERKGIPYVEQTTKKIKNKARNSVFLQDLKDIKEPVKEMLNITCKTHKTNMHKTDTKRHSGVEDSENCENINRPKLDRPGIDEEEKAVQAILEDNIETVTACNPECPVSVKDNCIQLVSETENKNKRMSLLARMKLGELGSKPHVVKVLADGTIMDCTANYAIYLP